MQDFQQTLALKRAATHFSACVDDLSAGVNLGKFSTMASTKAIYGVSLESPIARYSFSLPRLGQPSPPGYYGGVTLQGPPSRTPVWKPQTCPLACLFHIERGEKKRMPKKVREQLCSWLHLPPSVISIHCKCKQTELWKRKTWTEWRREKTWRRQEETVSEQKYLGTIQVTSSFTGITAGQKHTLTGNRNMAHTHTQLTEEPLWVLWQTLDTLQYKLVGQQLRTKLLLFWGLNDAPLPNLKTETSQRVRRLHFRGAEISVYFVFISATGRGELH